MYINYGIKRMILSIISCYKLLFLSSLWSLQQPLFYPLLLYHLSDSTPMDFRFFFLLLLPLLLSFASGSLAMAANQSQFFALVKKSVSGSSLSSWDVAGKTEAFCNFTGISCDDRGYVTGINVYGRSLSGSFPADVCMYLPELRVLRLGQSGLDGTFPRGISNCSRLEELDLSFLHLTGEIPDLSPMKSLRVLDLSYNHFVGDFPISVFSLTNLESLNFNEDNGLNSWQLPENISEMKILKSMILTTCMLRGRIPPEIGKLTSLVDLELSGNFLSGQVPKEISLLKNLKQLELYYNQLDGDIPEEIGNLTELRDLDMSVNHLTGKLPKSICRLPNLETLQLYNNSLTGEIPAEIADSKTLIMLSLYDNFLTGNVPENLGRFSSLIGLDLSENKLSGSLPAEACKGGQLKYFLVLQNKFTGEIPEIYAECKSLLRFRVSSNALEGPIPEGMLDLPHVSILDFSFNNLSGRIPSSVNARNLSELFMQNNRISGFIPPEISRATSLVKIDFSSNLLSGPIPSEIGSLKKLNLLLLQGNKLSSSIPVSLSSLKSLNVLDASDNLLTGNIPESLCELLPNSINFSNNQLSGPIPLSLIRGGLAESFSGNPGLCVSVYLNSSDPKFSICSKTHSQKKTNAICVIVVSGLVILIGALLFLKRRLSREKSASEQEETLSSSFFSYDVKSFHRISFDQREIIDSMVPKNIVGHGGSGTVYKIELNTGEVVAVKRLYSQKTKDGLILDKESKTEVETLGSIRHKNIVKLYCYLSSFDCRLLVYEYMKNGNLYDALHKGWLHLDWAIRHQIALGVAQGLAYLHHDLVPPIIHRDIKTTNILLDVNYQPKVADFGIAKVLQAKGKDSTTTVIAGTYGYLAPEYAYSSKATTKCDVYSFGVVLMELVSGKKPVEEEFGENKNIVGWISNKVETKEGAMQVLDKRLLGFWEEEEMIQVLKIAIRATSKNPSLRPSMKEVVQLLIEADPSRNSSKNKDDASKIKNHVEF